MCFGTLWTINILLLCPKVVSRIPFHVITVAQDRELVTTNGNVQHLRKNDEYAQCLKITEKVSFNSASEASYGYILSGQKLITNAKNGSILASF